MESYEANEDYVRDFVDFGFPEHESRLALKISKNDKEQAVELLVSGGADTETLEALAKSAKINKEEPPKPVHQPSLFAGIDFSTIPLFAGGMPAVKETKMVIAMRADPGTEFEKLPTGLSAKLVCEAVIRAYQSGQEFDSHSVIQWEYDAWPKIVVKCKSEAEL